MRTYFSFLIVCIIISVAQAQTDTLPAPFVFVETMPVLGNCYLLETPAQRDSCTQSLLYGYLAQSVLYPPAARDSNIQGKVVVQFIIETNGSISNVVCLRDIGGGCGTEAVRALQALNEKGAWWHPAEMNKVPVRYKYTMPVKFAIEAALPYVVSGLDTVYNLPDVAPQFIGGSPAFDSFRIARLRTPKANILDCKTDAFQASLLIRTDGSAELLELKELCGYGFDFEYEAVSFLIASSGKWKPGQYNNADVIATTTLRFLLPLAANCTAQQAAIDVAETHYEKAIQSTDNQEILKEVNLAIANWPDNTEYRYLRGMVNINENNNAAACEDLTYVKQRLKAVWFDDVLRLVCGAVSGAK